MKKTLIYCLCLVFLSSFLSLSPDAYAEQASLPEAVKSLCQKHYPGHAVTRHSGFGDERKGQWALVLTKDEQHVLVVVEKEKDEPAYRFTVENPNAFMPGDSQPNVLIDTGGDALFISFRKDEYDWNFGAQKNRGEWGNVDLILRTSYPELDTYYEWLMFMKDGLLFSENLQTDGNDNTLYRYHYPPIPMPKTRDRQHVSNYRWQDYPKSPPLLLDSDGQPDQDVQAALIPRGWALISSEINPGGIYVLGKDEQRNTRLLIKRWQGDPDDFSSGSYSDTISAPLPEGVRLQAQVLGCGLSLYQDKDNRAFSFAWDLEGVWRLSFVMAQDWYEVNPRFLYHPATPDETYYFGDLPFSDIRTIDLSMIPDTFEGAKSMLDQSTWAKVNNPDPKDRLHLRSKPQRNADSLGKFYNGTPVKALERRGEWVKVQIAHLTGWMMSKYLAFGKDMNHVQPAFSWMTGLESLENKLMPLYARPDEKSPVTTLQNIIYGQLYWIIGVVEEDWFFVYFYREGIGGYILQKWFWEGNG